MTEESAVIPFPMPELPYLLCVTPSGRRCCAMCGRGNAATKLTTYYEWDGGERLAVFPLCCRCWEPYKVAEHDADTAHLSAALAEGLELALHADECAECRAQLEEDGGRCLLHFRLVYQVVEWYRFRNAPWYTDRDRVVMEQNILSLLDEWRGRFGYGQ